MSWDIQSIMGTLIQVIGGGVGTWVLTEVVKFVPKIPINVGQKARIRSVAGILSAIAVVLMGFANDSLKPNDLQGALLAILATAGTFGAAHGTHKIVKSIQKTK
jgi:hypothetical protein